MRASIFFLLVLVVGCGPSPESAREQLAERGYEYSRNGLIDAVRDGDKKAVELFIEAGIRVNSRSARGETAIGVASEEGYKDLVRLLAEAGAKPGAEVLERTLEDGDWELSQLLLEAGAKPTETTLDNVLEVFYDEDANEKVVQMLSYADRRMAARYLDTVAGRLDEDYTEGLIEALLASGVEPSRKALENVVSAGNPAVMDMLLEAGARPSAQVLESAVEAGDAELV